MLAPLIHHHLPDCADQKTFSFPQMIVFFVPRSKIDTAIDLINPVFVRTQLAYLPIQHELGSGTWITHVLWSELILVHYYLIGVVRLF